VCGDIFALAAPEKLTFGASQNDLIGEFYVVGQHGNASRLGINEQPIVVMMKALGCNGTKIGARQPAPGTESDQRFQ
jgi:hypothetical protein